MPYINAHVSVSLEKEKEIRVKEGLGKAIELIPGKTEKWLMVEFQDNCHLYFRGLQDAPLAFVEVKVFGEPEPDGCDALTGAICDIFAKELSIAPDHVYVKYESTVLWGWNGGNF